MSNVLITSLILEIQEELYTDTNVKLSTCVTDLSSTEAQLVLCHPVLLPPDLLPGLFWPSICPTTWRRMTRASAARVLLLLVLLAVHCYLPQEGEAPGSPLLVPPCGLVLQERSLPALTSQCLAPAVFSRSSWQVSSSTRRSSSSWT